MKKYVYNPAGSGKFSPSPRVTNNQRTHNMKMKIITDYTGQGANYRLIYKIYNGDKYICRYSDLESAKAAYPMAEIIYNDQP